MRTLNTSRKLLIVLIILIFLWPFNIACSKSESEKITTKIVSTQLTEKENGLLRITGCTKHLIFDVVFGTEQYNYIDIWVDHYENGKMKEKLFSIESLIKENENKFNRISIIVQDIESNVEEKWLCSIYDENGAATGSTIIKRDKKGSNSSAWMEIDSIEVTNQQPVTLGIIIVHSKGDGIEISSRVLEDEELLKEYIQKYDHIYLMKCRFRDNKNNA